MPPAAIRSTTWYRPSSVFSANARSARADRSGMVLFEMVASRRCSIVAGGLPGPGGAFERTS
jgi:hypothetical protein